MPYQHTYKTTTFSNQISLENTPVFHPDSSGKEKDAEIGYYYFGARYYNSDLSLWLSVDPMSDKYPSLSPYNYCAWNPMKIVDPNGNEISPIFSTEGKLLGTDDEGYKGRAIVMEESSFRQGMSHTEAKSKGTFLDEYGSSISISDGDWNKVEAYGGTRQKPFLSNKSDERVFFKPDKSYNIFSDESAYPCEPHMDIYMPIDGIKTAEMKRNEVFKVVDKTMVTIRPNQCIPYTFGSNRNSPRLIIGTQPSGSFFEMMKGFVGNMLKGGLLKNAPDSGWNALRDAFAKY
ncbi:MAG: RHS repeat-associated core domain-containing protein [Bacteroidales bacterium]|nr:RHS repeat-associated core domain-containing protein [Bacteroidales bacterium]